ncbi:hypothetical protein A3D78_04020 [Candidatus Gottesmanbacteria bacterium RIFCSPHIGHO2_02_FULL_39_14]|uniref:DUF86 domain-containing protein n=1 Tax=Candidatus Gottesmanbacteria bacterium RIFCSPHIGHO2_02_FULL_39_14 TaxID=1798383 RepID=A0A1F5ZYB6_9BACT|nr:MAG: hypothetical protein A3D78_04020 [Candidatus Gottesmanbacteria bacterium RIFCSPHIGHO2_02_FULL_39_14]
MLDQYKIKTRIEEIRQTVKSLERDFKHLPEEKLITDQIIYRAAERNLEIAIQCIIDISNHIISQLGLERPRKENKEIFLILAKEKIIPMEFAKKIMTMVGYRNILVHEYLNVERHYTYVNIQENLRDFGKFAKYIEEFLQRK